MARITLADWTCARNSCRNPLAHPGLQKNFSRHRKSVPSAWIVAQQLMRQMALPLIATDVSQALQGDMSISHLVRSHSLLDQDHVTGGHLLSLRRNGITKLNNIGTLCTTSGLFTHHHILPATPTPASTTALCTVIATLKGNPCAVRSLIPEPAALAIPRPERRAIAERYMVALANVSRISPSSTLLHATWASDGSAIPASAGPFQAKSVIAAAVGCKSVAMRVAGTSISILQGELTGLVAALTLSQTGPTAPAKPTLLTDHLNSVRLVADSRSGVSTINKTRYSNGRSLQRWLLSLAHDTQADIRYIPAHTNDKDPESLLNAEADCAASGSQTLDPWSLPYAPIPTFMMNDYTYRSDKNGWIEMNMSSYADQWLSEDSSRSLIAHLGRRLSTPLHDPTPPPDFPYSKTVSAYSMVVQLYARSGQLPTLSIVSKRNGSKADTNETPREPDLTCRVCNEAMENDHHIFVNCPAYAAWRISAASNLRRKTAVKVDAILEGINEDLLAATKNALTSKAELLFCDGALWPLGHSLFYVGQIPKIAALLAASDVSSQSVLPPINSKRLIVNIANDWHTSSILLAGRIYGDFQRRIAQMANVSHSLHVDRSFRINPSTRR